MQYLRVDHDPQRQLLQVRQLWDDIRLRLMSSCGLPLRSGLTPLLESGCAVRRYFAIARYD